jgi:hypothetical protein
MPGNQTTLVSISSLPEFTDLVRRNWIYLKETVKPVARQLYIYEMVGQGQGNSKRYTEVDVETYADYKPEGANFTKSKVGIGYSKDMIARTYGKEIEITLEMRNDNRYQEIGAYITNLALFCQNRQELDLTHRLTFATSTSYVDKNGETIDVSVGDGQPLISNAHTLAFSPITYSNRVPGDPVFSQSAFEAALQLAATQIYSNFGEKRVLHFNTIITGDDPATVRAVRQLLQSTADIDAVQSGVANVYSATQTGFKHVILPNLATTASGAYDPTKRKWWFIAATGQGVNGWQAYFGEWIPPTLRVPEVGNNGEDIHNLNWTYVAFCRYGICIPSPKGIIGSCPQS